MIPSHMRLRQAHQPVVVSDIASATNAEPEGGLYALSQIDVGTVAGAEAGLEAIDNLFCHNA